MASFQLEIVTPDRQFYHGPAEKLIVRTAQGDVGILKGHAPYVSSLGIGEMKLYVDDEVRVAAISGGFIRVDKEQTTVVAITCEWSDEIDLERAKKAKEKAEEAVRRNKSKQEHEKAVIKLKRAINRIDVGEK